MKTLALALLWWTAVLAAEETSPWQIGKDAVLAPGDPGSWDDFEIRGAALLKFENRWLMLFQGVALSEDESTTGLGIATSTDGVTWKKSSDEPVCTVAPNEEIVAPSLVRWSGGFRAAYVVRTFSKPDEYPEDVPPRVEVMSSDEGSIWQRIGTIKGLSFAMPDDAYLRLCLYADSRTLHLWWIGLNTDTKQSVLCHSVSRDGSTWTKPNMQSASEIDSRLIVGVRVYPSGSYYILVYVVLDGPNRAWVVTKISKDAHSWEAKGPPEFQLPDSTKIVMPEMVFTAEGARLFYSAPKFPDPSGQAANRSGGVLATAFCPKSSYGK